LFSGRLKRCRVTLRFFPGYLALGSGDIANLRTYLCYQLRRLQPVLLFLFIEDGPAVRVRISIYLVLAFFL